MNNVSLIGRLTAPPTLQNTLNGTSVCRFSIAVDRRFKKEGQPTADFIPVVAWRQTAEFVSKYFTKGSRIAVIGSIQTRSWDDDDGQRHYLTEVVADNVEFCESKKKDSTSSDPVKASNPATTEAGFNDDYYVPPLPAPPPELNLDGYYPMPEDDDETVPF